MRKRGLCAIRTFFVSAAAAAGALLLMSAQAGGAPVTGIGIAELMTEGSYAGWYKYTYTVTWSLPKALSHLDLVLPAGCADGAFYFSFDTEAGGGPDGLSTDGNYRGGQPPVFVVPYGGTYEPRGDPSISLGGPVIKWEPVGSPGKKGVGQFWFYSPSAPASGVYEDVWAVKHGQGSDFGELTGAYPSCSQAGHTPEPATVAYLAAGAAAMAIRRAGLARRPAVRLR